MKLLKENKTQFFAQTKDIVTKDMDVFYNPEMEFNRTLSVELLQAINKKELKVCLPLAGTGVRALRMIDEIPNLISELTINDLNPEATTLIEKNLAEKNYDVDVTITNTDANTLLNESHGFDYIDIDPFGSPNFLLDVAIRRTKRGGILAVTATDTAAFAGTYPKTGQRKYWANSALCPQKHELGLRILARKVLLLGMHHEKKLKPVLSYHQKHYYRIFFLCEKGMPDCYNQLTSCFHYNKLTGEHTIDQNQEVKENLTTTGPLYNGLLQDNVILEKILKTTTNEKVKKKIEKLFQDNQVQAVGCYDMHDLCSLTKGHVKKTSKYIEILETKGFKAVQSAFNLTGIKTTAPFSEILKIL